MHMNPVSQPENGYKKGRIFRLVVYPVHPSATLTEIQTIVNTSHHIMWLLQPTGSGLGWLEVVLVDGAVDLALLQQVLQPGHQSRLGAHKTYGQIK